VDREDGAVCANKKGLDARLADKAIPALVACCKKRRRVVKITGLNLIYLPIDWWPIDLRN
jgi:hypothetical protein